MGNRLLAMVDQLECEFGAQAEKQTKLAHKKGTSLGGQGHGKSVPKTAQTSEPEPGPKWHEIVADANLWEGQAITVINPLEGVRVCRSEIPSVI